MAIDADYVREKKIIHPIAEQMNIIYHLMKSIIHFPSFPKLYIHIFSSFECHLTISLIGNFSHVSVWWFYIPHTHIQTHTYIYIYIYIYGFKKNKTSHIRIIHLFPSCYGYWYESITAKNNRTWHREFPNGPGNRGSIPGRVTPKTQKRYTIRLCLALSIIKYVSRVK